VKAEYDALRRIARLALDYVELAPFNNPEGLGRAARSRELVAALEDLQSRFPYTIAPRTDAQPPAA
jgi:hypothetical protein